MLIGRDIEALHLKPKFDRFTMTGGHDQNYALTIANTSTSEEAHRLPYEVLIRVRIHNMAARMWIG
jgi:hypothetical protein